MKQMLRCENLSYSYRYVAKDALEDVSLSFYEGEKIALIGRNGMGKSTLFLNLNGVYRPKRGQIYLEGEKIKNSKGDLKKLRSNVALVFQNPDEQFVAPTVEGEISFGLFNLKMDKKTVRQKVDNVAEYLQISHLLSKSTNALSGGEKKLVSIASILVMNPKIILFDEPTAGVDLYNLKIFKEALKKLEEKNITLVIATHDNDFVWEWAKRVIYIDEGKILFDGEGEDFFTDDNLIKTSKLPMPSLIQCQKILKEKKLYSGEYVKSWEKLKENL